VTPKPDDSSGFDRVGVGLFLKDISRLAVPMSLVAGVFALYLNAKIADIREMIRDAVSTHQSTEIQHFVSRVEWDAYARIAAERMENLKRDNERQTEQIRKNTILLERIASKIGVRRESGD
jgi:uncharacterized protein (DUF2252 family)